MTSTVSKLVSLDRRSISKGIKRRADVLKGDEPSWLFTKRKPRINSVNEEEVKQTICHFWTYEASRPNGDKKDIVRKRVGPKQYLKHTMQVLGQTQSEAFFNFRSKHPEITNLNT